MNFYIILTMILGYLFGCLQWSYILSRTIKKVDIRTLGKGNAGASNTVTVFGWKMGVAVGILDILKAIISILTIKFILKSTLYQGDLSYLYLNGLFVILGHNYPFFMKFKGGKGTASLIGMMLAIDYRLGFWGIVVIFVVTLVTDYIALGTISLVTFFAFATVYLNYGRLSIIIALFIALMSICKHIINLRRIMIKDEVGLRSNFKKKSKTI